ncbi:MAG: c-type cytochrome [Elusimicrobia bacterium]|nr:c-type cytochrome [Elusimicrobiota bacterium]
MRWLALCLTALSSARAAEQPGRAVFDAAGCRACHSIGRVGGDAGPDLTYVGFRRSREWLELWLKDPKAWKHDTKMPNFRLNDADRAVIVDYLASLKGQDFAGAPPWKDGEGVYRLAGCVACHGAQGRGGHPNNNVSGDEIPAVFKAAEGYNLDELKKRIRTGRVPEKYVASGDRPLVAMPAWGKVLSEDDIESVSRYLLSLAPPKKADDF